MKKLGVAGLIIAACSACIAGFAQAQAYPVRPVRIVIPWAAGGTPDGIMRPIANGMSKRLGQAVVIENKPGATGAIGADYVAQSAADGHTLLDVASAYIMSRALTGKPFDAGKDLAPIAMVSTSLTFLAVNPKTIPNVKSLREFIAYTQSNPAKMLDFASSGIGSSTHLAMVLIGKRFGMNLNHVPYKGTPAIMADWLAGRISTMVVDYGATIAYIKSGDLLPVMQLLPQRSPFLPDVPAPRELGYPELEVVISHGLAAPRATPGAVIDRLTAVVREAMADRETQDAFNAIGVVAAYANAQAYGRSLDETYDKWSRVVKENGITAQ